MNNRVNNIGLYLFCLGLILLAGCFPEDSLDWSADGSIGLLRTGEELYVVDGSTGALTRVPTDGQVSPWPDMSSDGKRIVYAEQVKYATLAEGLKALPADEVRMIANDAKSLRDKVLGGALTITDFNSVSDEQLGFVTPYRDWIIRSMCENADEQLTRKLGDQALQQGKASALSGSRLVVVALSDSRNKRTITTSVLALLRPRFSPDGRHVAYLGLGPVKERRHICLLPRCNRLRRPPCTSHRMSLSASTGGRTAGLWCICNRLGEEMMLGTLQEQQVCDSNGNLLEGVSDNPKTPIAAHRCTGESKQLVGTIVEPLMKVEYGIGGRLFFSSASGRIPSSDLDEPSYSLFCYDPVTGAVADVLPSKARNEQPLGEMVNFFSLSPDGRRVLLRHEGESAGHLRVGGQVIHRSRPGG